MESKLKNIEALDLERVQNIKELTERAATIWGDKVGLIFDEFNEQLTYKEINEKTNLIAKVLLKLGVKEKNRVAVMLNNRPDFPLTWLAIGKIGAIMVPINIFYKEFDAKYLLEHSEANVVITSSEYIPLLKKIQKSINSIKEIVSVDDDSFKDVPYLGDLVAAEDNQYSPPSSVYSETIMNIQYTSGTTGRPKGCMLSHNYWMSFARSNVLQPYPKINENDVLLTAQPFYYMDPQWNVITSLASGAPLIILDRFHPSTFWEKIREYKVTFFYCLGIMPVLMLKMPKSPLDRENNVRHIACSAIPVHLHKELEERWGAPWFEAFGMTETGSDIGITKEEHDRLVGSGSIGRPKNNREVRIVDVNDQTVPRGEIGELTLRAAGMMEGYYKNPEATKEAFRNGFFHTGDLAYMDEEGLIYYIGRKKEMIRRSGENISATEVEDVIKLFPSVKYVAALPVPDEIRGEEVKAYIVLQDGEPGDSDQVKKIIDFSKDRLAYFKIPRYWEFKVDLPRTPSERVAKHILRDEKGDLRWDSYDSVENIWRTRDK
jgi:carnitine-CoA ligase